MAELTRNEINRQDYVDNSIYQLITQLNTTDKPIEWNIEMISEIRDVVSTWLVDNLEICKSNEFYP